MIAIISDGQNKHNPKNNTFYQSILKKQTGGNTDSTDSQEIVIEPGDWIWRPLWALEREIPPIGMFLDFFNIFLQACLFNIFWHFMNICH